jgi:hypothetical protein
MMVTYQILMKLIETGTKGVHSMMIWALKALKMDPMNSWMVLGFGAPLSKHQVVIDRAPLPMRGLNLQCNVG